MKCSSLIYVIIIFSIISIPTGAKENSAVHGPVEYVYASAENYNLKAFVFAKEQDPQGKPRAAIVIFHGGGWNMGDPSWAFGRAEHFAEHGMIAVAPQYRLSNQKDITPVDAMEDARTVIRWVRSNANKLGADPSRIAAYGWSAGAHLAASAATIKNVNETDSLSCVPDALILVSPAVSIVNDSWIRHLVGEGTDLASISPAEHIVEALPPAIVLIGREDTVTPLKDVQLFCDRMIQAGNRCDLHIYDGVGHLFTPANEPDNGFPNPDLTVQAEAYEEIDKFLMSIGFLN